MVPVICFNVEDRLQRVVRQAGDGLGLEFCSLADLRAGTALPRRMVFLMHCGNGDADALTAARNMRAAHPAAPLILTSPRFEADISIWAIRERAWDYIVLPDEARYLGQRLRQATTADVVPSPQIGRDSGSTGRSLDADLKGSVQSGATAPAMDVIARRYSKNLSLEHLASACYMAPDAFESRFLQEHGIRVSDYLQEYRLEKAADLLLDTRLNVREVAVLVGYDDAAEFSRAFCQRFDCAPDRWRAGRKAMA